MCYSNCEHENKNGECKRKYIKGQLCPHEIEDEDLDQAQKDYEDALIGKYENDLLDKIEIDRRDP